MQHIQLIEEKMSDKSKNHKQYDTMELLEQDNFY